MEMKVREAVFLWFERCRDYLQALVIVFFRDIAKRLNSL